MVITAASIRIASIHRKPLLPFYIVYAEERGGERAIAMKY